MPDNDLMLRVQQLGSNATRNEIAALRKEVQGFYNDQKQGTLAAKEAGDALNGLNQRFKESGSNYGSYIQRTRELRREHLLVSFGMMSLIGTFDSFGGKTKEVTEGVRQMAGSALGVQFALTSMGGSFAEFAGPAGIIAAVVAGLSTFSAKLDEIKEKTKQIMAAANLTAYEQFSSPFSGIDPRIAERMRSQLVGQMKPQFSSLDILKGTPASEVPFGTDAQRLTLSYYDRLIPQLKEEAARKKEINELQRQSKELSPEEQAKKEADAKKAEAEAWKQVNEQFQHRMALEAEVARNPNLMGMRTTIGGVGLTRGAFESEQSWMARQQTVMEVANSKTKEVNKSAIEIAKSFDRVGTSIEQNLIGKLRVGDNLMGQILKELFVSGINLLGLAASGGATAGISGLFSGLLGITKSQSGNYMIPEPVMGIGTHSGRWYSFAESGMEIARTRSSQAASVMGRGSEPTNIHITGQFKQHGADMLATVEHATLIRNSRSSSFSGQ